MRMNLNSDIVCSVYEMKLCFLFLIFILLVKVLPHKQFWRLCGAFIFITQVITKNLCMQYKKSQIPSQSLFNWYCIMIWQVLLFL